MGTVSAESAESAETADLPDAVLTGLDPEQRVVATAVRGPVCVLAGAGTGKTRAITHRIAYAVRTGVVTPERVLAVTFTTRAAGEMRGRLRLLGAGGVQARTFHSAALRQLTYFWPRAVGGQLPRLTAKKAPLLAEAASRSTPSTAGGTARGIDRSLVRDLASEVEWAKVSEVPPDDYAGAAAAAHRRPPLDPPSVAKIYAAYEALKRDRGFIDFEDVLLLAVGVLAEHADVAEQVQAQYRYFVVDEYQDVNPLQQRLLDLWLGDRDDLCVVGDPSQTIYSFTGARSSYLLDFPTRHPGATVVRLVRDYRSTPQVVGLANRVLGAAPERVRAARLELRAQRPGGPEPSCTQYADEPAEAAGVASAVRALLSEGVRPGEMAVLFRTNAQAPAYEQSLTDAGVPYVVRGGERFFERPEVRQAVALLRAAVRSADGSAPLDGGLDAWVRHLLSSAGWSAEPPRGGGATRERWESLAALVALAGEMAAGEVAGERAAVTPEPQGRVEGLAAFVAELEARAAAAHAPVADAVTLASLHSAKGLEWRAVFLVGLADGTVPIIYAETPDQVEEERRLLYVGVTRAQEHLALSWARARSPGARGHREPSRFLAGLLPGAEPAAAEAGQQGRRRRGAAGVARCRVCGRPLQVGAERKLGRCAACPSDVDERLFAALKEWRLERAREQNVPAYCVFTDATLLAIAEAQPVTTGALTHIAGVGATKLDRYGSQVLALCADRETVDREPPAAAEQVAAE